MMHKFKFFWKSFSPFSNWYKCSFTEDSITYNCVEQYMMYKKAILFNSFEIASDILKESSQKRIKDLGRTVSNFNASLWDRSKENIVKDGCRLKFTQNQDLLKSLLKYKGFIFVEASPFDRIWGIGYSEENALANISSWGENLLGKVLTDLCDELG